MVHMNVTVGTIDYRIVTIEQDGSFCAHAERADSGERFGIETTASTGDEAEQRIARWLDWQHEHMQALELLQQAERVYHRAMAGAAFATPDAGPMDDTRAALEQVNAARQQLDAVRSRRPDV
jgi:hypothetical protein